VAGAIHEANPRRQFVPIDCGALVGTPIESELFGHAKGSFSGAVENNKGLMELADGSTALFFNEIGDPRLEIEVRLLPVTEEREFRPAGALDWPKIDLRLIAATHRDLKAEDLPLLRERGGSPAPRSFPRFGSGGGSPGFSTGDDGMRAMMSYDWPGNVRELKHGVDRMAALRSESALQIADMPTALRTHLSPGPA
jgi:transcriptional regulator with GAF, ATPase, and Fis domain